MGRVIDVNLQDYALGHYQDVARQAESDKHNRTMAKVNEVMGNAELPGEDQDLICQLLVEDGPLQSLMQIVANVEAKPDLSFEDAKHAVKSVTDFVATLEDRLYAHLSD